MNTNDSTIAAFRRDSLQVKVGAPRGLSVETHAQMLREARMQDWTVGQLLEHMWAVYTAPALAKEPVSNGRAKAKRA